METKDLIIKDFVNEEQKIVGNHKKYVGGYWDLVAEDGLAFLKSEGLCTYHNLLDIGCGSLRIGHKLIEFLDYNKYYGIDHHSWLIKAGLENELCKLSIEKRPRFVVSTDFNFDEFNKLFNYVIAKSVFTHLTKDKIKNCLANLREVMSSDGSFYATIFEGNSANNPKDSNDNQRFSYTFEEIVELAEGWNVSSLGNKVGNRQTMLRFTPKRDNFSVSIVTAAFRGELMPRVLKSIKAQTFTKTEWIIVNDAQDSVREWYESAMGSGDLDGLDVSFIDLKVQKGRYGLYSRNIGTMAAKYDRIIFLDDDNEWEPDHLESLISAERETGKIPYCWMRIVGKKPGSTFTRIKRTHFGRQGIDLGCLLYRKVTFDRYGYFPNSCPVTFDHDLMRKLFSGEGKENFICTNKPSLIFHHKRY